MKSDADPIRSEPIRTDPIQAGSDVEQTPLPMAPLNRFVGSVPTIPSQAVVADVREESPIIRHRPVKPIIRRPDSRARVIKLKSPRELALMREAGRVVALALAEVKRLAVPGVSTAELDDAVARIFEQHGATPLFKGVPNAQEGQPPFPAVICASVNEQVVHGIPNRRPLQIGDIISIDTGCRLNGWCGDSAVTLPIGEVRPELRKLLEVTEETLNIAIRAIGRCEYWSQVATLMESFVKSQGMHVIEKFVGHGIGQAMHEEPQVPNFMSRALKQHDIRLEPGLVLAIEPMVALGTKDVRVLKDAWTVETKDRRASAHFEHTVAITADGPEILTRLND